MVSQVPPQDVRNAAKRGLKWHEEGFGGSGLQPKTVREARSIARGDKQSVEKIRRMRAWFARHSVNENAANQKVSEPTPHEVAWSLWGGSAGRRWSESVMRRIESKEV